MNKAISAAAEKTGGSCMAFQDNIRQNSAFLRKTTVWEALYSKFDAADDNGLLVYGIQGHTAQTADGKTVLYAANMSKAPQKLAVKGAHKLIDGNSGKSIKPVLEMNIHDTFIGFVE